MHPANASQSSSRTSSAAAATSSLRPRATRLISGLDDDLPPGFQQRAKRARSIPERLTFRFALGVPSTQQTPTSNESLGKK